jgi:uncharacterized protein
MEIQVERQVSSSKIGQLGIKRWPLWSKEVSEFPWFYDDAEICYFIDGDVVVTPEGGEPVEMGKGDLVTFPMGMRCTWHIRSAVTKHYKFG